ncbi:polyprenol phosphomannose-dependent alpha 1,6 mannosyltransferase MptB [Intrasporangium sp. DVR]|uniref:polyprenol phosphomannose-dependent alpha 1,6 mannosyltransferase MptB n=1 Tax=Intrasporangium sp. DVR TaxID=3127867 RepID=UPI00313A6B86
MGDGARPTSSRDVRGWRFVGLASAIALAASSWGSGSRPTLHTRILWPGLAPTAESGGSPLAATVSVVAMGGLVLAWWRLRTAAVGERWWWGTAALWFAPLLLSVPLYSRDLYSYAAQGALWAEGLSPYEHGVSDLTSDWRESTAPTWLESPSPYGPVWLLIARGAAVIAGDQLWVALLLLRVVAVAAAVVLAWAVSDVARRVGAPGRPAAWLAVSAPLVGAHFVSGAHNDAVMVAAVVAGFALALRGRFVPAVVLVALGAMVKVTAVVALPFVALLWARRLARAQLGEDDHAAEWLGSLRRREVASGLALTVVTAALVMALVSRAAGIGTAWLNPMATPGRNEQWTSLPTALGMAVGAVGHVLGRPEWRESGITVSRTLGLVVLAVVLVLIWLAAAKPGASAAIGTADRRVVRAAGWAFLAVVVLAPAFLGWYFLWALPLLAATDRAGESSPASQRWLPAAATVLAFAQLPDGYSLGLTTTAVGVPLAVLASVFLLRAALRWARRVDWAGALSLDRPLATAPVGDDSQVRPRTSPPDGGWPSSAPGSGWATTDLRVRRRPRRGLALFFAVVVLGLLAFALWALTARTNADDVAAYAGLRGRAQEIRGELAPLGISSRPPCGLTDEGWTELTWGAITGPTVDDIETYLRAHGWRRLTAEDGVVLRLEEDGRELTARVSPPDGAVGVRLTLTSEASSLACLLH